MERNDKPLYQGDINPPDSLLTDVLARLGLSQASSQVSIDDLDATAWQKRAQAIQALDVQISFNRLLEIADDSNEHEAVRSAALRALGKLGKQAPVRLLVDILHSDAHRDVRGTALHVLGELREQGVRGTREYINQALTDCLTDTDDIVRIMAVQVAGIMGKQLLISQLGQLKKMLRDDPSWHVRETVALTLGMLGEYATVMQALYDTDRFVRDAARLALKQHLPQAIDMLVGTLAYGKPAEREQAACALGEMGIDTPIKNLENAALMDKSSTVRKAAVLALGQLEEHTPVATLSRVALLDRDEDVREAAKLVLSTIDLDIIAIEGLQTEKQTDALTADFHVDRETDNSFHSLPQQEEGNTPYIRSHSKKKGYIGYVLGSYKLIKQFDEHKGRGTHVYLGEHVSDRTHVAVKVFPPQTSDEEAESFRQAVAIIAQLKQKNIVPIISFDVGSGIPFIVMDYMSGGNVRQHYPEGQRVPFPTVIKFVKRIAEALQYAHNHKPAIIHQDIKPENLLFNAEGNIFLSDFGFEQSILRTSSNANRSAGPNYYIAPEQLHMSRKTSPATDQYTLAAIVYEWLCGRPLFEGKPTEIVRKIRSSTPPSLCEQVPQLPQQVENVVIQALAKQPLQRFASVQAFAQAFTAAFGI